MRRKSSEKLGEEKARQKLGEEKMKRKTSKKLGKDKMEIKRYQKKKLQKIVDIIIYGNFTSCLVRIKVQIEFHVFLGWESRRLFIQLGWIFQIWDDDDDRR